ncbi:MAG: hypothetical protein H5T69_07690 [Chloroflexi bacterium]|nr:hypothetical protein [Chloroflexota bacterium]
MATLVAFASLPFGLRGGVYEIQTFSGVVAVHVSELQFNPFLSISPRPELAQSIPKRGQGEGFTSYTWYDHPFVLRVVFGRHVASLGSINSCATVVEPLPSESILDDERELDRRRQAFGERALAAFNNLIAAVRRKAKLYHVFDLRRDDIDLTVRREDGTILIEDPLQTQLIREEAEQAETFDLLQYDDAWYQELTEILANEEPVGLAEDLLIEAERALAQRFPRQAIATCHTAIEAAASALLTRGMLRQGYPDDRIDFVLSTRSLTSKLDVLLRQHTGFSLKRDQRDLWRAFNRLNDLRNDIVHRGKEPTTQDAEFALQVGRDLLRWLHLVRRRNR